MGGSCHFLTCPVDEPENRSMTVGFGQGAVSVSFPRECPADMSSSTVVSQSSADANLLTSAELGLGGKVPFSAARPTRLTSLDECEVIEYVADDCGSKTDHAVSVQQPGSPFSS